ncbi:hypothetical protein BLOT_005973 [Blomia tropicalis]|nr:hypothetical protein BLOT_005973 [Blomia tropicalis]
MKINSDPNDLDLKDINFEFFILISNGAVWSSWFMTLRHTPTFSQFLPLNRGNSLKKFRTGNDISMKVNT